MSKFIITQDDLNEYIASGGSLELYYGDQEGTPQMRDVPQRFINRRAEKGGDLSQIPSNKLDAIPHNIIEQYVINGGDAGWLSETQVKALSREALDQYAANGGDMESVIYWLGEKTPQECVEQYIANGGDLRRLSKEQTKALSQDAINQYAAKGGNLGSFANEKVEAFLQNQELVNQRLATGTWVYGVNIRAVPKEYLIQYAIHGGRTDVLSEDFLTDEQLKALPKGQELVNLRFASGENIYNFSAEALKRIPKEFIIQRFANYGLDSEDFDLNDKNFEFLEDIIPQELQWVHEDAEKALILYAAGKLKSSELPMDVFVNYDLRKNLLEISKCNAIEQFNNICQKYNYYEYVPEKVKKAFDKKLKSIQDGVTERKEKYLKYLVERTQEPLKHAIDEVDGLEW